MFIVVLGGGIDLRGNIPNYVYTRLDKAIKLYKELGLSILVSGKYSFLYSSSKPPITEASKMFQYLVAKGVPEKNIIKEEFSKDTVGNAYYVKKYIFLPKRENKAIIVTSDFQIPRVEYIFNKIFGSDYKLKFVSVKSFLSRQEKKKVFQRQKELLLKTKAFLSKMKDGDHNFLYNRIYKLKYYREKRPAWVKNFVAKGK